MSKYLVITGGSRGIGKATIELFMRDGWKAVNISRSTCDINGVINFNIDLSKQDSLKHQQHKLLETIADASKICLVHNASVFNNDDINTLSAESLREVLEFNLVSTQSLNTLLLPHMHKGSAIIYVGSTLSEMAVPGRASYVISKHALIGMMRATCQDLRGRDITTCCVCPGFVNTTMLTEQVDADILQGLVQEKVIAGRLIEPAEIAELIHYCAGHPVINGAVLHANLGQVCN